MPLKNQGKNQEKSAWNSQQPFLGTVIEPSKIERLASDSATCAPMVNKPEKKKGRSSRRKQIPREQQLLLVVDPNEQKISHFPALSEYSLGPALFFNTRDFPWDNSKEQLESWIDLKIMQRHLDHRRTNYGMTAKTSRISPSSPPPPPPPQFANVIITCTRGPAQGY